MAHCSRYVSLISHLIYFASPFPSLATSSLTEALHSTYSFRLYQWWVIQTTPAQEYFCVLNPSMFISPNTVLCCIVLYYSFKDTSISFLPPDTVSSPRAEIKLFTSFCQYCTYSSNSVNCLFYELTNAYEIQSISTRVQQ